MKRRRDKGTKFAPSIAAVRAGPAPTIKEHSTGRVWRLGWNTQDAKAALEMVIVSQLTLKAIETMKAMRAGGLEYFEMFQNRVDSGAYHTFAPGWRYVMAGLDASWVFLLSLLLEHQPNAIPEDAQRLLADEPEQVQVGVGVVAPDFFTAVAIQVKAKNVSADQAAEGGRAIATAIMEKVMGVKSSTPAPTVEPVTG